MRTPLSPHAFFLLVLVCAAVPSVVQAQKPARLKGKLLDTASRRPIASAVFTLLGQNEALASTSTDDKGRFKLSVERGGSFHFRIEHVGYPLTVNGPITLVEGEELEIELHLSPEPIHLDSLAVTTDVRSLRLERAGFYHRKVEGAGLFIDREDIERKGPVFTTDLFDGLPGVSLVNGGGTVILRGGLNRPRTCFPTVFVDDIRMGRMPGVEPARLDELITPNEIEGIEIYRTASEVPLHFGGSEAFCGVILIWSR